MPSEYQHNILVFDIETMPQETLTFPLWRELAWGTQARRNCATGYKRASCHGWK